MKAFIVTMTLKKCFGCNIKYNTTYRMTVKANIRFLLVNHTTTNSNRWFSAIDKDLCFVNTFCLDLLISKFIFIFYLSYIRCTYLK